MVERRRQLTLFVAEPWRSRLSALRHDLDPVQAALIDPHVTLCREDEIERLGPSSLLGRIESWPYGPIGLSFGPPQRFGGYGVLLPCEQGQAGFHQLRQWVLQTPGVRVHDAHLTLAHPRNPRSAGNTDAALGALPPSLQLEFASVLLIEQFGDEPWQVLAKASLGGRNGRSGAHEPG